ncbi:MAG: GNAT family N-acetyltransferase [Frisingicoccus sp.]
MKSADCLFCPEYQQKGYGSQLMDVLEKQVFQNNPVIHIDASFPAESMYLKRGYKIISYEKIETENGDFLCYHRMEKNRVVSLWYNPVKVLSP